MAVQDQLKQAKNQQQDIPFTVVSDDYMKELTGKAGPGNYQYGGGPSVYAPFAPGTKTLASQEFDENKRAQGESEKLAWQQYEDNKKAKEIAQALAASKASGSTGSNGSKTSEPSTKITAGNPQAFADAIKGMNQGHTWWQQAQDSTNKTGTPQDYAPYINEQLTYGERTGMPLSEAEIKALQDYATKLFTAEASMLNGYKGGSGATDLSALTEALGG